MEPLLAFGVASGLIYTMVFLARNLYLPQPYFFQPSDTFMDWFNVAGWAHDNGAYDAWGSIYPPLNFAFLRIFSLSSCYTGGNPDLNSLYVRSCDWIGIAMIHIVYVIDAVIVSLSFVKNDRKTAFYRAFALIAGLQMTFALERGNLIMLAFLGLVLGYGPLLKSARLRWFFAAWSINFKIYLVSALFGQLLRRRWRWFEGAFITTILLYLATYALYGGGSILEIGQNLTLFFGNVELQQFTEVLYSATYNPHIAVLTNTAVPIETILGQDFTDPLLFACIVLTRFTQLMIVLAAIAIWVRPEAVPMIRITNLALALALVTVDSFAYSYIITIFFTFLERWRGIGPRWAIVAAYLLCLHFDYPLDNVISAPDESFLGGVTVQVTLYIMLGPFVRPLLFYSIPVVLAFSTIRAVWVDIRLQGWRTRWRYRRDFPIMTGTGAALPPA